MFELFVSKQIFIYLIVFSLLTFFAYMSDFFIHRKRLFQLAGFMSIVLFLLFASYFLQKYKEVNYPPFRTLFESLIFLGLTVSLIYIIFERFFKITLLAALVHFALAILLFYAFFKKDADTSNLPAALQSAWFIPHVAIYFLGYAALFLSAVLAALYLWRPHAEIPFHSAKGVVRFGFNQLMHFMTIIGFIFIGFGLVIGALWAKEAWGEYWAWDPKENWSLITFLLYSIYFHLRNRRGISEKGNAKIIALAFLVVMFTYLGMNLLPTARQSEHVYIEKRMGK